MARVYIRPEADGYAEMVEYQRPGNYVNSQVLRWQGMKPLEYQPCGCTTNGSFFCEEHTPKEDE